MQLHYSAILQINSSKRKYQKGKIDLSQDIRYSYRGGKISNWSNDRKKKTNKGGGSTD